MLKVGLTGGMASGKTTVGKMFVNLGAELIQADAISRDLLQPGQAVYDEVVRHFGKGILNPDSTINRKHLADATFGAGNSSRVKELNSIIHPEVIRLQEEWMDKVGRDNTSAIAIVEAALILEAGSGDRFDKLIVVTCSEEQRVERFATRQNANLATAREEVRRRMAAQLSDEEKKKRASFVIDNSGSLADTAQQVNDVWKRLAVTA